MKFKLDSSQKDENRSWADRLGRWNAAFYHRKYRHLWDRALENSEVYGFVEPIKDQLRTISEYCAHLESLARNPTIISDMSHFLENKVLLPRVENSTHLNDEQRREVGDQSSAQTSAYFLRIAEQLIEFRTRADSLCDFDRFKSAEDLIAWLNVVGAYTSTIWRNVDVLFVTDLRGVSVEQTVNGDIPVPFEVQIASAPFKVVAAEVSRIAEAINKSGDNFIKNHFDQTTSIFQHQTAYLSVSLTRYTLAVGIMLTFFGYVVTQMIDSTKKSGHDDDRAGVLSSNRTACECVSGDVRTFERQLIFPKSPLNKTSYRLIVDPVNLPPPPSPAASDAHTSPSSPE